MCDHSAFCRLSNALIHMFTNIYYRVMSKEHSIVISSRKVHLTSHVIYYCYCFPSYNMETGFCKTYISGRSRNIPFLQTVNQRNVVFLRVNKVLVNLEHNWVMRLFQLITTPKHLQKQVAVYHGYPFSLLKMNTIGFI